MKSTFVKCSVKHILVRTFISAHQPARHHYFSQRSKKGEKRKLKKEDISLPTNFQHISHVGWDPNRGFDLENVDPKLKQFFSRAGVSERELQVAMMAALSVFNKCQDFTLSIH